VVQTWFWFAVGFAYIFLGIANCYLATRLRQLLPLVGPGDIRDAELQLASKKAPEHSLKPPEFDEALVGALYSLRDFVDELNKTTETSRCVLYLAALSFFIAAGISFVQGIGA
jgi:hypothetical protein